jgi:O-antigen/teichoic acid export membrane protein
VALDADDDTEIDGLTAMSATRSVRRQGPLMGTAVGILGEGISLPAALVTAGVLTRGLGPEAYGRFTVAATLVTTLEWILVAMFAKVVIRFVAEASDWRPVAATAFRSYLLSGSALGAALWLLSTPVAAALNDPLLAGPLRLFALEIPVFTALMACRNILVGVGGYRQQALTGAARWIGRMLLIVLFVQLGWAVQGAILGSIGGVLLGYAVGQVFVGRATLGAAGFPYRRLLHLAAPAFLLMLTVRLFDRVALLLLNAVQGAGPQVGYYGAAQNLSMVTGVLVMTATPVLVSTVSAARGAGNEAHARAIVSSSLRGCLALLPFAAIVAGSSEEVFRLLFGPGFAAAAPLGEWMAFVSIGLVTISVATSLLIAHGRIWGTVLITAPLLPASVLGHLVVIPRFGALGAAGVTAVTALVGATVCLVSAQRAWNAPIPLATLARSLALALLAYVAASSWPAPGVLVIGKAIVLSLSLLAGFLLLGELSPDEITGLRRWWWSRRARPYGT